MTAATSPATGSSPPPDSVANAARGTALNLIGAVTGAVVGFVTIGVITNTQGQEGAGLFFAATALFTLGANGARLGGESGLTYFVARLRAEGRHAAVPGVIGSALVATAVTASAVGLGGLLLAPQLARLVAGADATDEAVSVIRVLALAVPTFALSQTMFGASRGFSTMRPSVLVGQILRPLVQLSAVTIAVVTADSVFGLALAWAVASAVALAAIGWWLRDRIRRVRHNLADQHRTAARVAAGPSPDAQLTAGPSSDARDTAGPSPDARETAGPSPDARVTWPEYLRFAAPRAGADLVSAGLERLDVILVAALVGTAGAGLYGAAGRLILAGQLIMIAASQSMAPLLTSAFTGGRLDEARTVLRTITAWNVVLLWPAFLGLGFGAPTALSLFGPEFVDAWPLVVILAAGLAVVVAMGAGDTLLTATGDSTASLVNHVVALAVMVATALVMLPSVGIVGAAWAWALSRLTLRGLATARVWRTHGVHAFGSRVALATGISLVAYVPSGVVALVSLGPGFGAVAVHAIAGTVIHGLALRRFRHRLDLDLLVSMVARRRGAGTVSRPSTSAHSPNRTTDGIPR